MGKKYIVLYYNLITTNIYCNQNKLQNNNKSFNNIKIIDIK